MKKGGILIICFAICLQLQAQSFVDVTDDFVNNVLNYQTGPGQGSGVSAEDYDGDGDLDFAVCTDRYNPARVLINIGDDFFDEINFNLGFHSRTALWIDYDGDHTLDLMFIGDCQNIQGDCSNTVELFQQQPDGSFISVTEDAGLEGRFINETTIFSSASAADLNEDGYLDVLITFFDIPSKLLMNNGDGTFRVIEDFFGQGAFRKNWTSVLYDIDRDGWLDYYQASDLVTPNQYWTHDGDLAFYEIASDLGIDYAREDMGVTIGDYDNDEDLDIYITNIQVDGERGNVLYRNDNGSFSNQSFASDVFRGGWGWGVSFMDGNNDGWLDIAATNGWGAYGPDSSKFWLNQGAGVFDDISTSVNFNDTLYASALIASDFDRDGDLDMVQTLKSENHTTGLRILRNELLHTPDENYLIVQPRMEGANHWAIGSLVKIVTDDGSQIRPITAGISYYSQEPAEAFFGVGDATNVSQVEVTWPGGGKTIMNNVAVNQVITVTDEDALHPPKNLSAEIIDESTFRLSWQSSTSVIHTYQLERSKESNFSTFQVVETEINTTSYDDSGLSPDTTYYYRVRANKEAEFSRSSLHIAAQFSEDINAPNDLAAEGVSLIEAMVTWSDRSDNESGFTIQRSAQPDFSSYLEFDLPLNSETFLNDGLEPGATYYYRIQAYSDYGHSEFSDIVSVDLSLVLNAESKIEDLIVYPNPSEGFVRILSPKKVVGVIIFDALGKVVAQFDGEDIKDIRTDINKGIYQLQLQDELGVTTVETLVVK